MILWVVLFFFNIFEFKFKAILVAYTYRNLVVSQCSCVTLSMAKMPRLPLPSHASVVLVSPKWRPRHRYFGSFKLYQRSDGVFTFPSICPWRRRDNRRDAANERKGWTVLNGYADVPDAVCWWSGAFGSWKFTWEVQMVESDYVCVLFLLSFLCLDWPCVIDWIGILCIHWL